MPAPIRLNDRVVVMTGGGLGLGASMAKALAGAGARVILAAPEQDRVDQVAAEIAFACGPDRALPLRTDITNVDDCQRVLTEGERVFGRIDVLVNNARSFYKQRGSFWEADADAWRKTIAINLTAPFTLARLMVPAMVERGFGRVINITSSIGMLQARNYSQYGVTKSGLESATVVWAKDLGGTGVTVNLLNPGGMVDTDPNQAAAIRGLSSLPADVMDAAIVWLASDRSADKTGGRYDAKKWDSSLDPDAAAAAAWEPTILRPPAPDDVQGW